MRPAEIAGARHYLGMSVKDLAKVLEADPDEWWQWEKGKGEIPEHFSEELRYLCGETERAVLDIVQLEPSHINISKDFHRYSEMPKSWRRIVAYRAKMQLWSLAIFNSRAEMSEEWREAHPDPLEH